MAATLSPFPVFRALNAGGVPLVGGKLFSYASGTATPMATYTDATGGTPNTNPVILDSSGSANVWLNGTYKLILQDSSGIQQWSVDNIGSALVYGGDIVVGAIQSSALTASSAVATDASKNLVSVTNTGTGSNVLATSPTLVTPILGAATATTLATGQITNSAFSTDAGHTRVSTQFDKTSDTTLANVTGLSVAVVAAKSYYFDAHLMILADSAGGVRMAINGTCTATAIRYWITGINNAGTNANASPQTSLGSGTASNVGSGTTQYEYNMRGLITVGNAGNLNVQFAQSTSSGTASSILVGSTFIVEQIL